MAPTNKGPIATGKAKAGAGKGGKAPAAKAEVAAVAMEVEEDTAANTTASDVVADTVVVDGLPPAGEIGNDAADALSAVQQEWSGNGAAAANAGGDAAAGDQVADVAQSIDDQIDEVANATFTAESSLGTVLSLGNLYKTALHVVLVAPNESIEQSGRSSFPVTDLPFAFKKGAKGEPDRVGFMLAAVQAFSQNFQAVFNRELLVVGDAVILDGIAKKVANDAGAKVAKAVINSVLQHLYAVDVNSALGEGAVSSDDDVDENVAAEFLKQVAGFSCTVSESGVSKDGVEEVTFTLVIRATLPGLADVKDAVGEHGRIESALTAAQGEAGISNLQLTWLVGDKSLVHPSNLAMLGHLLETEYYKSATSGELYQSVKDETVSPFDAFWNFFPINSGEDVLRHASAGGVKTGTLDGTWVATTSYAAEA